MHGCQKCELYNFLDKMSQRTYIISLLDTLCVEGKPGLRYCMKEMCNYEYV